MVDIVLFGDNTYRVVESGVTLGFIQDRMGSYVGFAGEEFADSREVCTSFSFDFCVGRIAGFA
jgi:F0F1-type ATP synthase beta subunit